MTKVLEVSVDPAKWEETTIEDWDKAKEFENAINYCVQEGMIELEEGDDGEIRLYPTS